MLIDSPQITGSINIQAGPSGSRPTANLASGSLYFNTDVLSLEVYTGVSGSKWQAVGSASNSQGVEPLTGVDIEYLVVAGGGSGGAGGGTVTGGGGGAGGYLSSSLSSIESGSSITVTVGAGGAAKAGTSDAAGELGGDSSIASAGGTSFVTVTASGGGGGGGNNTDPDNGDGGSGAGGKESDGPGGSGTVGQGNDGGSGTESGNLSGGGGGAGEAGNTDGQGYGGDGLQSNITGTLTYYAGGGSSNNNSNQAGVGGQGGGGNAPSSDSAGDNGDVNTGGGGSGGYGDSVGASGAGGSGVVILAYTTGSVNGAGGITGTTSAGKKYHQFNSSDTLKLGSTSDFQIVSDSLMVHYDAGNFASRGASTWTDLKGNYNSTVTGATLGSNFYYDFDGSNDYMTNSIAYSSGGTYTFNWWMNADTTGTDVHMICEHDSDDVYMIHTGGGAGNLGIRIAKNAASATLDTTSAYTTGTWQYFSAVFSPSGHKLYRNGSLINSDTDTSNTSAATGHQIGRRLTGGASLYYNGKIGMIHIYSKELSSSEITQNYNATKTNFV